MPLKYEGTLWFLNNLAVKHCSLVGKVKSIATRAVSTYVDAVIIKNPTGKQKFFHNLFFFCCILSSVYNLYTDVVKYKSEFI